MALSVHLLGMHPSVPHVESGLLDDGVCGECDRPRDHHHGRIQIVHPVPVGPVWGSGGYFCFFESNWEIPSVLEHYHVDLTDAWDRHFDGVLLSILVYQVRPSC